MSNPRSTCPFAATTVRFTAYVVKADFEYRPDSGDPAIQHVIQYRFESPNPFSARSNAIREIRRIKQILDSGLVEPGTRYQFEGIVLWLEYEISQSCSEISPVTKRLNLLDGKISSRENVLQRLSSEEFLLDVMGFSFVRGIADINDEQDYSEMVDELFEGLSEIEGDLIQKHW